MHFTPRTNLVSAPYHKLSTKSSNESLRRALCTEQNMTHGAKVHKLPKQICAWCPSNEEPWRSTLGMGPGDHMPCIHQSESMWDWPQGVVPKANSYPMQGFKPMNQPDVAHMGQSWRSKIFTPREGLNERLCWTLPLLVPNIGVRWHALTPWRRGTRHKTLQGTSAKCTKMSDLGRPSRIGKLELPKGYCTRMQSSCPGFCLVSILPHGGGGLAEFQGGWMSNPPPPGWGGTLWGPLGLSSAWHVATAAREKKQETEKEQRGKKRKHSDVIHINVSDSDASASSSSSDLVSSSESSSDDNN